jgi:hypothetical protein
MKKFTLMSIMATAIIFTSCKKEENKAPTAPVPPVVTATVDTYVLASTNGGSAVNVVDTIYKYTNSTEVGFTIPLNYNSAGDTMLVTNGNVVNSYSTYKVDHVLKYNTAYRLKGYIFNGTTNGATASANSIYITFEQQLSADSNNVIRGYNLTYSKI